MREREQYRERLSLRERDGGHDGGAAEGHSGTGGDGLCSDHFFQSGVLCGF